MSAKFYPNGAGGAVGDRLDTCKPLQCSGNIWYVSSDIGTDAATPAGQNREKPLATIAQAITNSVNDDIIVCLQGHTETLTAFQAISKRLSIVGEGTTAGKPGVTFKTNAAAAILFLVSSTDVELRNLYFPEGVQTNTGSKIQVAADFFRMSGCYFDCGAKDTGSAVVLNANSSRIESTTFISTGVLRSAQPLAAIKASPSAALTNIELVDVVVSAGTVGFSNYAAIDLSPAASVARLKVLGISLLLGADMNILAGWTGYINCQLTTGSSRVDAP